MRGSGVQYGLEAEQAGRALDGVRGAEGGVEVLLVARVLFHHQQRLLELAQHVAGLVEKAGTGNGQDFVVVVRHLEEHRTHSVLR